MRGLQSENPCTVPFWRVLSYTINKICLLLFMAREAYIQSKQYHYGVTVSWGIELDKVNAVAILDGACLLYHVIWCITIITFLSRYHYNDRLYGHSILTVSSIVMSSNQRQNLPIIRHAISHMNNCLVRYPSTIDYWERTLVSLYSTHYRNLWRMR